MDLWVKAGDAFIWVTSLVGGFALILATYQGLGRLASGPRARAMQGRWFGYAYFQTQDGPKFYKEVCVVERERWRPWKFSLTSTPSGSDDSTRYKGTIISDPPFVYMSHYEPIFGDRTFEIYRWQMDGSHSASMLVGIHLGRTYEETIHNATPIIMTRRELDPDASLSRNANAEIEQEAFDKIVGRYFSLESGSLQLLFR